MIFIIVGKKNNFVSIIALGNFNPAILTPQFLLEKCHFRSEAKGEGQTTPVVSSLDFNNVSFIMELEKFQIMEKDPSDFGSTSIVKLIFNYLELLAFTPVFVVGLNFNVDIEIDPAKAIDRLNKKELILDVFNAKEIVYDSKVKFSKDSLKYIFWDIIKKEDFVTRMTVNLKDGVFKINYNIEKRNIASDRNKVKEMDEMLPEFNSKFEKIIGDIFQ
jgi:hypothetical protein